MTLYCICVRSLMLTSATYRYLFRNVLPEAICCSLPCYVEVMLLLMDCVCITKYGST